MKVLVTGSEGLVGGWLCKALSNSGHSWVGLDTASSGDVLDLPSLQQAASGCNAIVHCAALLGQADESPSDIMAVNLQGTWNVLLTARHEEIEKVVFLSSVDVLGIFKGERTPDFLPVDESHPCYPNTPYAISKWLAEQMCRQVSAHSELSVICLRPPGVWEPATYDWVIGKRTKRAEFEWDPFWEYGAFIDVRDLAQACLAGLSPTLHGFRTLLVASNDLTTSGETAAELSQRLHPQVQWRGGKAYVDAPFRTLLLNDLARQVLNWQPQHRWSDFADNQN